MRAGSAAAGLNLILHGVVFAILFGALAVPAADYSLSTAIRSGANVTTGDPQ